MKFVFRFVDLLLYTSVFTACCATGLCMATERLINGTPPLFFNHLHILVFSSSLLVYNTPRLIRKPNDATRTSRYRWWYVLFFFVGLGGTVFSMFQLSRPMLIANAVLGVFAFAYFLPLLPFKNKRRLRDIGWLKIAVLAGVWTTATAILPILFWQKNIYDYPFEILVRFVFIFTLCVIFDIRDARTDLRSRILTLPNTVGIKNSYRIINVTLVLFAMLSVLQYFRYPLAIRLTGALLTAVITWAVAAYLRNKPSDRAYLLLADGVMLLYAVLVFVL